MQFIHVKGARCHNLKNITVKIPRKMMVVFTGLSGSGKSSLVFDTLYAEGQRRYLESFSGSGGDLNSVYDKPDVSSVEGLSPTVAIGQKFSSRNPRSTVGTVTEIHDFLRLLYTRAGNVEGKKDVVLSLRLFSFNSPLGACASCHGLGIRQEVQEDLVIPNTRLSILEGALRPFASSGLSRSAYWQEVQETLRSNTISLDKPVKELGTDARTAILHGISGSPFRGIISYLEKRYRETDSGFVKAEIERYMRTRACPSCNGARLNKRARAVLVFGKSIDELSALSIIELKEFLVQSNKKASPLMKKILKEIIHRLGLLEEGGLTYITLDRGTTTLSGGELQRMRLATQIGLGLTGVTYVLDEPSIGLHQSNIRDLIKTLKKLQKLDNSILVVEHDREIIEAADYIIDIGPGAGDRGGEIVAEGKPQDFKKGVYHSDTALYLSGKKRIPLRSEYRKGSGKSLIVEDAIEHNLQNITARIPLGTLVSVTGVSGSGKSTLVHDILARALSQTFHRAKRAPGRHKRITGMEHLNKVIMVDQSPIGRTPRSNPATYTGLFAPIRDFYSELPEAKKRGYTKGHFSFNVTEGRCDHCRGEGQVKIEMFFMPDMYTECPVCRGARYNAGTLEVKWNDMSIADMLNLSVEDARTVLKDFPKAMKYLHTLYDVGLGYVKLGQPATTLSGGEAQRVKLATELSRPATGKTLYILDEPTVGLHFADIEKLLKILHALTDKGNTIVVIEHNIEVIQSCDWVIDLGPEGGKAGGEIVATGTPQDVAKVKKSLTGQYLKKTLESRS